MTDKSMLSCINDAIRSLCKETGESLVNYNLSNDGVDFKTKRYGGSEINPTVILNSQIAKIMECLINGDSIDEESQEKELIRLLIVKHSGKILAKALKEAEEDKVKQEKEAAKLAKKLAKDQEQIKTVLSNPEVKKRRRKNAGLASVDFACPVKADSGSEAEAVVDIDIIPVVQDKNAVEENPFDELEKIEAEGKNQLLTPAVKSMDDFLAQEKLKALNALNDEPTI